MSAPRPIFVLGLQRSGTTWIGNLLAAHPDVAGATDAAHHGIHESLFFSHFARAWDWSREAGRAEAAAAFARSDYGQMIGFGPSDLRPTAAETFRAAMDRFAAGRLAWVEKTPHHTRLAHRIARDYPDAAFVLVSRDSAGLVRSRLAAYGRTPPRGLRRAWDVLRGAASNRAHARLMRDLARRLPGRCVAVDYGRFRTETEAETARLLAALDLPPRPGLASAFAPNSSFARRPAPAPLAGDRLWLALGDMAGRLVPLALMRRPKGGRPEFPRWVWRRAGGGPDPRDKALA